MPEDKKTIEQVKEEAEKSYQDFRKELERVRQYQENNSVVTKSYGGYVIDLGNGNYNYDSKKPKIEDF